MKYLILNDILVNLKTTFLYTVCSLALLIFSKSFIYMQFIIMCFMITHVLINSIHYDSLHDSLAYYTVFPLRRSYVILGKVIYLLIISAFVYFIELLVFNICFVNNTENFVFIKSILAFVFSTNCLYLFFAFNVNAFLAKDYLYYLGSIVSIIVLLIFNSGVQLNEKIILMFTNSFEIMGVIAALMSIGIIFLAIMLFNKKDL